MSENEIIERVQKNAASPTVSSDTGLEAAAELGKIAAAEQIEWAIAGGIAMYLYGSPRLTKDVDIIAARHLPLAPETPLNIGGGSYTVEIGKYKVTVDWIVRADGYAKYYRAALAEAIKMPGGFRLISPEWMVILKMFAGRQKDYDDAVFLLKQENLVNRPQVKQNIVRLGGEDAWLGEMSNFRRLCALADGQAAEEAGKYYDED
jgi:hypothetical protein